MATNNAPESIKHTLSSKTETVEWRRIVGLVCLFSISMTLLLAFVQTVDLIKKHNDKQIDKKLKKELRDLKTKLQDLIKNHCDDEKLDVKLDVKLQDLIKNYCDDGTLKTKLRDLIKNHCDDETLDVKLQDLIQNHSDETLCNVVHLVSHHYELQSLIDSHRNHIIYKYVPLVCAISFAILIFTRRDLDLAKVGIAIILFLCALCPFLTILFSSTIGLGEL